jgi:hypothetical protein
MIGSQYKFKAKGVTAGDLGAMTSANCRPGASLTSQAC